MEKQTRREFLGKTGRGLAGLAGILGFSSAVILPSSNGCSGFETQTKDEYRWVSGNEQENKRELLEFFWKKGGYTPAVTLKTRKDNGYSKIFGVNLTYPNDSLERLRQRLPKLSAAIGDNKWNGILIKDNYQGERLESISFVFPDGSSEKYFPPAQEYNQITEQMKKIKSRRVDSFHFF